MNKKQKKMLLRIIISAVLMVILHFVKAEGWLKLALYMIPYLIIGYDVLLKAFKGIKNGQPFDECLLMTIATIGAIVLGITGSGDYVEAVAVMLFYQVGEWFQSYAVGKSRKNISELMDIRPDYANIQNEDGTLEKVDPYDVEIGDIIVIQPGEKVPLDGTVEEGTTSVNTSALTGESVPRTLRPGDRILSGFINMTGVIKVRTEKEFDESTASKILDLVENASSRKSRSENFISRFARIYTPAVVIAALLLATLPLLYELLIAKTSPDLGKWAYRALNFLVVSCPCALVISIPLSFFAGLGGASKSGILIKGSNYLEQLAGTETVVFDKTGTLTKGVFEVTAVHPDIIDGEELLHMAAHVERYSLHPIAVSLKKAYPNEHDDCEVSYAEEITGQGMKAMVNGKEIYVGNSGLMDSIGVEWHPCHHQGTIIHVSMDGVYAGHIVISDVIKENAREALESLKKSGVRKTVMLTGDNRNVAEAVSRELKIDEFHSDLLPEDKVLKMEEILEGKEKGIVAFVGDGINDAPVLSRADIGIAMGAMGSDAAIEAADVVLMDDDPRKISKAIRISKKCLRIVYENIWFAIGVKILCLILGALGLANMWMAIFADVGVMVIAVLNAIRALFVRDL
ncbi:MAG: cadmium-translocating P-type ATPase [Clostridia bacterium]|nr:cadmium-translocating P-type ATPase [Clostridia bacterium]